MTTIGRYEIREQIGTGSMGTVYRAHDMQLDREVALKTIRTGMDVEPEIRERFFREARACARLQHPSIITVYDLGEENSVAYIAMELLRGSDFRQLIKGETKLPLTAKIDVMIQVCEALGHAHQHGVIHRDVKPSNLFLIGERRAKVLDFGIARLPSSHLTVAGKILGTPNYMSPEQILGKPVDARSDLFSAAIVFFELLVQVHPFQAQTIPRRIVESEPDSLFDHDSSLPTLFEKIFARALAKDSDRRYRSGAEFAEDLRALLEIVRQNASPTFGGPPVLPSERAIAITPREPKSEPTTPLPDTTPAGEDPYEWRFSEIMRLMPEFEDAMKVRDENAARAVLQQLESVAAVDQRFAEAIALCRSHVASLRVASVPVPSQGSPKASSPDNSFDEDPTTTPTVCDACGGLNRSAAQFCRTCGARLKVDTPKPAGSAAAEPMRDYVTDFFKLDALRTGPEKTLVAEPAKPPTSFDPVVKPIAPQVPTPAKLPSMEQLLADLNSSAAALSRSKTVWAAAGLLALIVLLVALLLNGPIPVSAAVAVARVNARNAAIHEGRLESSKTLVAVQAGDQVRVLKAPVSLDQEWVQVQYVSPKQRAFRPGYMHTSDLDDWDSQNPDIALSLIRIFRADRAGTVAQIDSCLAALEQSTTRFARTPAVLQARLLMAELQIKAVRLLKESGALAATWQARLDAARNDILSAGHDPALRERASELQAQLDILSDQPPPVATPAPSAPPVTQTVTQTQPPQPALSVQALLAQAEKYRSAHNFDKAEALVKRVLARDPNNAQALELGDAIKRSRDFFNDQR
jgi:serine/threonine protein kinase